MTAYKKGAVSIFVVVFTALLITIVTVSFVRLMVREQHRASSTDLSQSAYDAALAGVEDAKRALVVHEKESDAAARENQRGQLGECSGVPSLLGRDRDGDQGYIVGDSSLQQAYTCVKVTLDTADYVGKLGADQSRLIPLQATGSFNKVRIEWFSKEDVPGGNREVNLPADESDGLVGVEAWATNRPPVVEAQLMQIGSDFTLTSFDSNQGGTSNVNTLFLYPKHGTVSTELRFINDARRAANNGPWGVTCSDSLEAVEYACSVDITVPGPIGGGRKDAYLRLVSRYNNTDFRVSLYNGSSSVNFNGVQPEVDATGRASDLFRRVSARVESSVGNIPYPEAAVDVTGNFCKTFRVTDSREDYSPGQCTP